MDKFLQQLAEIDGKIDAILAGDLTDDKVAEHDTLVANREQVAKKLEMARANQARVDERQRLEDEAKKAARSIPGANRQTDAVYPVVTVPATPINHAAEQSWGFNNFGHYAREVHSATISQRPSTLTVPNPLPPKSPWASAIMLAFFKSQYCFGTGFSVSSGGELR